MWWTLRDVEASAVWAAAGRADPWLLSAAVAVAVFGFVLRAARWKVLLEPVLPGTALRARFSAIMVGFMINNVLPWRLGEIARGLALSRMAPIKFASGLGSIVAERTLDMLVLFGLLTVPLVTGGFPAEGTLSTGTGATVFRSGLAGLGAMVVLTVVLISFPGIVHRAASTLGRWVGGGSAARRRMADRALRALADFLGAMRRLRHLGVLGRALAWSLLFWVWNGLSFYLGMLSFGIGTGFLSALYAEAVVGWFSAVPGPPGFIGNFHAAVKFALADAYGADPDRVLGFAFGFHLGGWIPVTAIGLWYAVRIGLTGRRWELARARYPTTDAASVSAPGLGDAGEGENDGGCGPRGTDAGAKSEDGAESGDGTLRDAGALPDAGVMPDGGAVPGGGPVGTGERRRESRPRPPPSSAVRRR